MRTMIQVKLFLLWLSRQFLLRLLWYAFLASIVFPCLVVIYVPPRLIAEALVFMPDVNKAIRAYIIDGVDVDGVVINTWTTTNYVWCGWRTRSVCRDWYVVRYCYNSTHPEPLPQDEERCSEDQIEEDPLNLKSNETKEQYWMEFSVPRTGDVLPHQVGEVILVRVLPGYPSSGRPRSLVRAEWQSGASRMRYVLLAICLMVVLVISLAYIQAYFGSQGESEFKEGAIMKLVNIVLVLEWNTMAVAVLIMMTRDHRRDKFLDFSTRVGEPKRRDWIQRMMFQEGTPESSTDV